MKTEFKRVPALDKCFTVLELFAKEKKPLGISEISKALNYNKSTVFNMVYTLTALGVLENGDNGFSFGTKLYVLGKAANQGSELIHTVHPFLENISQKTKLSAFLGIRSALRAIIIDKVDSPYDIKISSEIGMSVPLLASAGGKVLLSQLPDEEIDQILSKGKPKKFTTFSRTNKRQYMEMIKEARQQRFAIDDEEYIEGIRGLAVPLTLNSGHVNAAIWIVGLKSQIKDELIPSYRSVLKEIAEKIETRFSLE
ncbi:MAG: IclR family transcriptional regulator [Deltaproteobacteria bacterium]|nr:MAG: IclR family transcriptional regulator [Deltaproteobacteria bacterium]